MSLVDVATFVFAKTAIRGTLMQGVSTKQQDGAYPTNIRGLYNNNFPEKR